MTQAQLNHQVARITGEPLGTLRSFGFSLLRPDDEENEPEDIEARRSTARSAAVPCRIPVRPGTARRRWPSASGATSTSASTPATSTRSRG